MVIRFVAGAGGSEEAPDREDNWFEAGVSENPDGSGRVLIFQCQLEEPDEQDTSLGMDTYCVSNESGGSTYAGIESIEVDRERLRVVLTDASAEELELSDTEIEVDISGLDDDVVSQVHDGLRRILAFGRPDARPSRMSIG